MTRTIDNAQDVIDSRDFIKYMEDIESQISDLEGDDFDAGRVGGPDDPVPAELRDELTALKAVSRTTSRS